MSAASSATAVETGLPAPHLIYSNYKGFFDSMRLPQQVSVDFLKTVLNDKASPIYSILADETIWKAPGMTDLPELPYRLDTKRIHLVLNATQKERLSRTYGQHFRLEFTNSVKAAHPLSAVVRQLETEIIMGLCDHSKPIGDSGGNYAHHIACGRGNILCFCPRLSDRDYARDTDRVISVSALEDSSNVRVAKAAREFKQRPSSFVRFCKTEFDDTYLKTLIWIHSIYDHPIQRIADQMDAHGSEIGYGCFMYSDAVLDSDSGELPDLDAWFTVDCFNDIRFGFQGDSSHTYKHRVSWYKEYLVDQVLNGEYSYYYQVFETGRNTMIFVVTRLNTLDMQYSKLRTTKIRKHRPPRVTLTTFGLDYTKPAGSLEYYSVKDLSVPYQFYHDCLSFAFSRMKDSSVSKAEPLTREMFFRQARTLNRYVTINGIPIMGVEKVDLLDLKRVSWSLYHMAGVMVAYRRVRTGLNVKYLMDRRSVSRGSVFSSIFRYISTFLPEETVFSRLVDSLTVYLREKVSKEYLMVLAIEDDRYHSVARHMGVSTFRLAPSDDRVEPQEEVPDIDLDRDDIVRLRELAVKSGSLTDVRYFESKLKSMDLGETGGTQSGFGTYVAPKPSETDVEYRKRVTGFDHDPADVQAATSYRESAVEEFLNYCQVDYDRSLKASKSIMIETWDGVRPRESVCRTKMNTVESPNYILFSGGESKRILVPVAKDTYMYGICPLSRRLVPLKGSASAGFKAKHDGWLFVCSDLHVLNSDAMVRSINDHLNKDGLNPMPEVSYSQGAVGSGKTHRAVTAFLVNIVIACITRSTVDEILDRLEARFADQGVSISRSLLEERVRTLDSLTINPFQRTTTLIVDEACMAHIGQVFAAASMVGASKLILTGDNEQIQFINRNENYIKVRYHLLAYFLHYEFWFLDRRNFSDTVYAMNKRGKYSGKAMALKDTKSRTMTLVRISGEDDPQLVELLRKADLVLVCYKYERELLSKLARKYSLVVNLRTVHEAQGNDKGVVVCVRLMDKSDGLLYDNGKHDFVGMTRYYTHCYYATNGPERDGFVDFIRASQETDDWSSVVYTGDPNEAVIKYF